MITLLTDFGLVDNYVGIIKGVIYSINPDVQLIDLSHNIPPQNLWATSFLLNNSIDYFHPDTIHLIVVDPTVGTKRKPIAMVCEQGYFICPDNGILTGVIDRYQPQKAYVLDNPNYWLTSNISKTFHGRDLFAPVAAHLANGISLDNLGTPIDTESLVKLDLPSPQIKENTIEARIQYIDIYGNLITNIPAKMLVKKSWYVMIDNTKIEPNLTYSNVDKSSLVALIGSHGYLEIAVNGGSAKISLAKDYGDMIKVIIN